MTDSVGKGEKALSGQVTGMGAWALAFGCSVGWGAFVMPGTTFLPVAGPVGTLLGIGIGAVLMLIIGANYHFLMNRYPGAGGTYTYTKNTFGYDHGFLNAWFLILTYVAIIWANASALPLIARNLLGSLFQVGFHYEVAGFQVYLGEVLLAIAALVVVAMICVLGRPALWVQILMALILFCGVCISIIAAVAHHPEGTALLSPAFAPDRSRAGSVFTVIALAPWAFVGFESIAHSSDEFRFSLKKVFLVLAAAVITAAFAYGALTVLAVSVLPEGYLTWPDYIADIGSFSDIRGLPTFHAAGSLMGRGGAVLLGLTTLGAIATGLIGHYIAASRLLYALAQDGMMPGWLGKTNRRKVPSHALVFLLIISIPLPFLGRTAISWIVDVTTVGAAIAYAYASASAWRMAVKEKNRRYEVTGLLGLVISLMFILYFMVPNLLAVTALSTESYLILGAWGILGILFFLYVFRKGEERRLGHSLVTWLVLTAIIVFTTTVWMRQSTNNAADQVIQSVADQAVMSVEELSSLTERTADDTETAVTAGMAIQEQADAAGKSVGNTLTRNILIQTLLIVFTLFVMFYIYYLQQKRKKQIEVEKVLAEENSRAKTSFLSNMSHEIRTPMNAIIGLDNIALRDPDLAPHTREQLEKIGSSARHLLGLINDILDMSRIESGRMVLKDEEFSFQTFFDQINIMIGGQCSDKGLDYNCGIDGHMEEFYIGDDMKLKQVLINILGNAVKFTDAPGRVSFTASQTAAYEGYCTLRFRISDTGIGMSREYIPKIFEAFSQENDGALNKYGSTGLGMAITKNIVEMMNGEIQVESEKGVGTTFTVAVTLKASSRSSRREEGFTLPENLHALIVDDDEVACRHAKLVAGSLGIQADICTDGANAVSLLQEKWKKDDAYDIILTDFRMSGMDGVALTKVIRTFDHGALIIIVLTGYSTEDVEREVMGAGADTIVSKPLFSDTLLRTLQSIILLRSREGTLSEVWKQGGMAKELSEGTKEQGPDPDGTGRDAEAGVPGKAETGKGFEEISLEGRHILVAEDLAINAEILIDLLELEGMTADHAENGQAAVEMFCNHPLYHYDAILMDVRMPVMDGLTAARRIRAQERDDAKTIPIIALTANAFDEDVKNSLQAGMNAHLSKPIEPERLYETLKKMIVR